MNLVLFSIFNKYCNVNKIKPSIPESLSKFIKYYERYQ
jgi:hypothetical protein